MPNQSEFIDIPRRWYDGKEKAWPEYHMTFLSSKLAKSAQ